MFQVPGSKFQVRVLSSGSRFDVGGSRFAVPGSQFRVRGSMFRPSKPAATQRVSEILCVGHGMRRAYAPQTEFGEGAGRGAGAHPC
jgi:hypothetical protein